jgi:general secretion pathway protein K
MKSRQHGFALLVVLWSVVLLAFLTTRITASGHAEAQLVANLRDAAITDALADGAVQAAAFHLLDASAARWRADGAPYTVRLPGGEAEVTIRSLAGRVSPNLASPALLQALLARSGADAHAAALVAAAIVEWRSPRARNDAAGAKPSAYRASGLDYDPPGAPFESLEELGDVLGMTPTLLTALSPHLSLYAAAQPDFASADPIVRQAIADASSSPGVDAAPPTTGQLVEVIVTVAGPNGTRGQRRAVLRIGAASLFEILEWT